MAQLKSTTINGDLAVTGGMYCVVYDGSISCNNGYLNATLKKFGSMVIAHISYATKSGVSILRAWNWAQISPSGAWPAGYRPAVNMGVYLSMQGIGAGVMQINTDGSVHVNPYGDFGNPWACGADLVYMTN